MKRKRLLQIIYWKSPEKVEDLGTFKLPLNEDGFDAAKILVVTELVLLEAAIAAESRATATPPGTGIRRVIC